MLFLIIFNFAMPEISSSFALSAASSTTLDSRWVPSLPPPNNQELKPGGGPCCCSGIPSINNLSSCFKCFCPSMYVFLTMMTFYTIAVLTFALVLAPAFVIRL